MSQFFIVYSCCFARFLCSFCISFFLYISFFYFRPDGWLKFAPAPASAADVEVLAFGATIKHSENYSNFIMFEFF